MVELALFEPEIPQNTGTLLRVGACFGVKVHIIEPCGFAFSSRRMKRAGMDYIDQVEHEVHDSWNAFHQAIQSRKKRVVLLTPRTDQSYLDFEFTSEDVLLLGRESDGVPDDVFTAVDQAVAIPMQGVARSLNVAVCGGIVIAESTRQLSSKP